MGLSSDGWAAALLSVGSDDADEPKMLAMTSSPTAELAGRFSLDAGLGGSRRHGVR